MELPKLPNSLESFADLKYHSGHYQILSKDGKKFPLFMEHARLASAINFKVSPWRILTTAVVKGFGPIALLEDQNTKEYRWIDPMQLSAAITQSIDNLPSVE